MSNNMEEEIKKEEIKEGVSKEKEKKEEKKEEATPEEKKEKVSKEEPKEQEKEEKPEKKEEPAAKAEEEKTEKPEAKPRAKEKPVEVPKKFKKIVEEIEKMSVLDLAELVKILEKKFGVSATPPVVAAPVTPGAAPAGAPPAEEKSVFNIVLTEVGDKKIEVIKAVRDVTQKGLKESKDLVDAVASGPQVIKENVKKEEAEEIKKKFETAGAKVELK